MNGLVLPFSVRQVIEHWAASAYPHEGCGLLVGRLENGKKIVERLVPLQNRLLAEVVSDAPTLPQDRQGSGAGRKEFVMDPAEFHRESLAAEREGLDVVGIIHTHPEHPARPSAIDASQPFLAMWSNVIVSVMSREIRDIRSWFREDDSQPFSEEQIFHQEP